MLHPLDLVESGEHVQGREKEHERERECKREREHERERECKRERERERERAYERGHEVKPESRLHLFVAPQINVQVS
jgi:Ni/Co efflux regulator RcnB